MEAFMSNYAAENALILDLCKFQSRDAETIAVAFSAPLNLPYILGQLLFHRVGGVAYHKLKVCELLTKLNREFRNPLSMIYDAFTERTRSFLRAEETLTDIFVNADFPFALLKGAYLAQLYPVGLRTSNDFDVLIRPQDVQKITDLLKSNCFAQGFLRAGGQRPLEDVPNINSTKTRVLGSQNCGDYTFTPATRAEIVYARMNKGETVPFVKQIDLPHMRYLEIDVNFSPDFKANSGDVVDKMLSRTEPLIETKCGNLPTLCRADFLIHLCAHLYKEATTFHWVSVGRDLSLYKFVDILLFVDNLPADLAARIADLRLQKECAFTFIYTRELFALENSALDALITSITPENTDFLREVFDPQGKRTLCHNLSFTDYLFCPNRLAVLEEV
jgi:hypothetical protein